MVQESATIEAAQAGDIHAFNELVLQYQDAVYTVAYRILQDPASADDITQDTFITAFRKLEQFQGGNFRAWLQRIATNACYDELRRRKRRRTEALEDSDIDDEADVRLATDQHNPERAAQQNELQSAIEDCFERLAEAYRLVAIMADVQDYSYEEIATLAKISLGTVKSRISRARTRLRDCLQTKGELLPAKYRSSGEG